MTVPKVLYISSTVWYLHLIQNLSHMEKYHFYIQDNYMFAPMLPFFLFFSYHSYSLCYVKFHVIVWLPYTYTALISGDGLI